MTPKQQFAGDACGSLESCPDVNGRVRRGIPVLAQSHRGLLSDLRRFQCSLNLDEARRREEPNSPRWDYVLASGSTCLAMEVHPAKASEVEAMLRKKHWAQTLLGGCDVAVQRWCWVRPPKSALQFLRSSPQARRLAKAGIEFPASRLVP
jgi:hypothetical protein